ncbi:MAG: transcriptional regulator [Firmicutes bacterium]|nr:transcriptional regulator [Bacillota bacterium]
MVTKGRLWLLDQGLLVFVTVVEKANFTRAAEALNMTQPAVSQYIQALERSMGSKLLERSNKFVRLNKAGEIVYQHAKGILVEYFPLIKPSITIGNTQEIGNLILNRRLDVGIVEGELTSEQLAIEPVANDLMYIVSSPQHALAQRETVTDSKLKEATWIIREVGSGTREAADKMFAAFQWYPEKVMEFGSTQIIKEAVEAGLGISLLSQWVIRKELSIRRVKLLKCVNTPVRREFSLVTPAATLHTKAAQVFIHTVREYKNRLDGEFPV